jgi:hypothetical protein
MRITLSLGLVLSLLALMVGCGREEGLVGPLGQDVNPASPPHKTVELPAGSVDGLAAAIAAAGRGGTVIVKSGSHTENATVVIDGPVSIVGEGGAVMYLSGGGQVGIPTPVDPGLHVVGATNVAIRTVEFRPLAAPGGTAILIQDAPRTEVVGNKFYEFQYTVLIEKSDHVAVELNLIESSLAWTTGEIPDAYGIVVINGEYARISGNSVSDALFGIWACDLKGTASENIMNENFIGFILCRVPEGSFILPDGTITGAENSATAWQVHNNVAKNSFDAGYLVIDGANRNHLSNTGAFGNGTYDIELVGDSFRFGFLTPTSRDNVVTVGSYKSLKVKDCGLNNILIAPNPADINIDPCF